MARYGSPWVGWSWLAVGGLGSLWVGWVGFDGGWVIFGGSWVGLAGGFVAW